MFSQIFLYQPLSPPVSCLASHLSSRLSTCLPVWLLDFHGVRISREWRPKAIRAGLLAGFRWFSRKVQEGTTGCRVSNWYTKSYQVIFPRAKTFEFLSRRHRYDGRHRVVFFFHPKFLSQAKPPQAFHPKFIRKQITKITESHHITSQT